MKVGTENDNNFGYEKITILGDNMPLRRNNKEMLNYIFDQQGEYCICTVIYFLWLEIESIIHDSRGLHWNWNVIIHI